jgi:UDPglucose 6-dehydrogenase
MAYNIGVIGTGYVGLVTGTCFAATGNNVYCIDIVEEKVNLLKQGKSPIYEPGLDVLLQRNLKEERLHFSTELEDAVKNCQIIFLCLPTPPNEDGSADLHHVLDATEQICHIIKKYDLQERKILINKSTVPVGTADKTRAIVDKFIPEYTIDVASNPEFLREGFAIEDSLKPERVVIGTDSEYAEEVLKDLYMPFMRSGNPIYIMDIKSAEITKYAANAFLATKISFMNDLSAYCEVVGADIEKVRLGIGSDTRIGKRFLFAGVGYGGSCFPKDVRALIHSTELAGTPLDIVSAAQAVNLKQTNRFITKIKNRFDNQISEKKFAIWGLAFKPDTDDTREAPAFIIIDQLLEGGATVSAYDPEAMKNTKIKFGDRIVYCDNPYDCLNDADALIIATEWTVFRNPDFQKIQSTMKEVIIFDGRNLYSQTEMEKLKFEYHCIGRKSINAK